MPPATSLYGKRFDIHAVVKQGICIGCGACAVAGGDDARMRWNRYELYEAELLDAADAPAIRLASAVCPFSDDAPDEDRLAADLWPDVELQHSAALGRYLAVGVGRVADRARIEQSSSGGLTSYVLRELLATGKVDAVLHVRAPPDASTSANGALMEYRISDSAAQIDSGGKSRYYPVEMSAVLRTIRGDGRRFALVGVPCFIKAARLLCRQDPVLKAQLRFMLGLVCGHLKSGAFARNLAWQMGVPPDQLAQFDFRVKDAARPANAYSVAARARGATQPVIAPARSLYGSNWGHTMFRPRACDLCDDVAAELADACFGDAWLRKYDTDWRGTNIFVTRNPVIASILADGQARGELELADSSVDEFVQSQLANYRHRRGGLGVRLADRKRHGLPSPTKRHFADEAPISFFRRRVFRARAALGEASHELFLQARGRGEHAFFISGMAPLLARYSRMHRLAERLNLRNVAAKFLRILGMAR